MSYRRYVSVTGRRWLLALIAVLSVVFASIAYVQFDARRRHSLSNVDLLIHNEAVLRNEIEEIKQEKMAEKQHHRSKPEDRKSLAAPPVEDSEKSKVSDNRERCTVPVGNPNKATFDVSNMTYSLTMADLNWDGDIGVWDPDTEAKFQAQQLKSPSKRKLKVFVVPFSHSDPGWLMTVDQYLSVYTKNTLDLVLERLQKWPDMTFIWAEVSFFELWWQTLDEVKKEQARKLVASGRLEIVNGGYVMPDEASTHYYGILHQYVYGHQWLRENLNTTPRHGFSIDPFGYSSTMPYLLKNLGFESIFIQRIHYVIRKRLLHAKASQFAWQQPWDAKNSEAMFTYLSHATLYDIKHTCGQDNSVCIQFDWQYQSIQDGQDFNRTLMGPAKQLLEQFQKTSTFYPHDVILFPIGMDFRWTSTSEWDAKHQNFRTVMDILNGDPAYNVEMKFGTYNDYYKEVFRQMGTPDQWKNLPSVTGDFFPYADRTIEYWTGYFTSHPFQKALNRDLENHLRTAEILYMVARMRGLAMDSASMLGSMWGAAKSLGLYQHHDAITGTSKAAVNDDYEQRLFKGVADMYDMIQYTTSTLMWPKDPSHEALVLHSRRQGPQVLPSKTTLLVKGSSKRVVIVNSLASYRHFAVDILIDSENVAITDSEGKAVAFQTSLAMDSQKYQGETVPGATRVTFLVEFQSIGIKSFVVKGVDGQAGQQQSKLSDRFTEGFSYDKPFLMENQYMKAAFSPATGLLQTITDSHGEIHPVQLEFKRYETMKSGAYLFWPYATADMTPYHHHTRFLDGPLYSELQVVLPGILRHTVRLFKSACDLGQSLHIENIHNLMLEQNLEAVMRFSTGIKNNFVFHTDSNGFQMVRRRASPDLPMQANYFPATTMTFLQDQQARLTLHMGESHGVGSQNLGEIEVMLDRFLSQDDARGVEEALKDPRTVRTSFRLQLETSGYCRDCLNQQPTSLASRINLDLNNPANVLSGGLKLGESIKDQSLASLIEPLPCNTHLVMLKPVTYNYEEKSTKAGVMLHRLGTDCSAQVKSDNCRDESTVNVPAFLNFKGFAAFNETTFNFIDVRKTSKSDVPVTLDSMKIVALTLNV
ncbi:Alpha-mannosidase 2x [Hypsibius exemplaris]|uniref:Alpha-mannosidase n=1 Tax=Hypsibius exemplaris TaxID=2072580 RepID=A0A1W0X1V3_HYPEX|nr:Alpha-mannosidase 2x [Hypsibius exemplaris]